MGFDIDEEINKIITDNQLFPFFDEIESIHQNWMIVSKLFDDLERVGFYVLATSAIDINEIVIRKGINCKYTLFSDISELRDNLIEEPSIVFISFNDHELLCKGIAGVYPEKNIIDLYKLLYTNGYKKNKPFFDFYDNIRDPYADCNHLRNSLLIGTKNRLFDLQKLIYTYIDIRDFKNAFYYLDMYIKEKLMNYQIAMGLKNGLERLLNRIKRYLEEKEDKSVIFCLVDSIQYDVLNEMHFLDGLRNDSLCFTNAFTITPFTVPTYHTIFSGKRVVEDQFAKYKKNKITTSNSELLRIIAGEKMQFFHHGISLNLFEQDTINSGVKKNDACEEMDVEDLRYKEIRPYKELDSKEDICTMVLWRGISDLVKYGKVFTFVHIVAETHTPYICGTYDGKYVNNQFFPEEMQVNAARDYADQQLSFYHELCGKKVISIFASDHGKVEKGKTGTKYSDVYHTFLMCLGDGIPKEKVCENFSYINFAKLIKMLIHPDRLDLNRLISEYVQIEDLDMYGIGGLMHITQDERNEIPKDLLLGYQAVRDGNNMLKVRNDGRLEYYIYPCPLDLIRLGYREKYKDDIEKLECRMSYKKNIPYGNFYSISRMIWEGIGVHDFRTRESQYKADMIMDLYMQSVDPKSVIALRGSINSAYGFMERYRNRYNIKYIIDEDYKTPQLIEDLYLLNEDNAVLNEIDLIIMTSYKYRHEIMSSLKNTFKDNNKVRLISIFDIFSESGLDLGEEYRTDKIKVSDIPYKRDNR